MLKRRTFISYSLLFLGGCTFAKTDILSSTAQVNRPNRLRFAVTDLSGAEELEQNFGPFRRAVESILEIPVDFYPVDNYLAAAPALLNNELDLAMAGPSEYLLLRARAKAVPIIGITRPNYYSLMVTLQNSPIETVADLKGKTIAMRTEGSTAGHIFPMKLLLDAGLSPQNDFEVVMLGDESPSALLNGQVDAWADSHVRYEKFSEMYGLDETKVKIIGQGENLPPDVFVVSPMLDSGFVEELRSQFFEHQNTLMTALLASEANQKYQGSKIVSVEDTDYQNLRNIYIAMGQESAIR